MYWIIENLTKESSYRELAGAVRQEGITLLDISGDFELRELAPFRNQLGTVNGTITMVELVREHLPGCVVYSTQANFLCSKYYPYMGDLLFNDFYIMLPLCEFSRQRAWIYEYLGRQDLVFLRPDSGEKTFKGQLIEARDIDDFIAGQIVDPTQLVIVSNPKNIRGEWRFVVSEKDGIVAYSSYQIRGKSVQEPVAPAGAIARCESVLARKFFPDPIFCVDIAEDDDGAFLLLELTAFSSAGLYACDKSKVARGVKRMFT